MTFKKFHAWRSVTDGPAWGRWQELSEEYHEHWGYSDKTASQVMDSMNLKEAKKIMFDYILDMNVATYFNVIPIGSRVIFRALKNASLGSKSLRSSN